MHKLGFLLFFVIFLSIYSGMHFYVYRRVSAGLNLSDASRIAVKILFVAGAASFFIFAILSRRSEAAALKPFYFISMAWLGVITIALSVFIVSDMLRLVFKGAEFKFYSTAISVALVFLLSGYSLINVMLAERIKELRLKIPGLPENLNGFTIVQLSDIHMNTFSSKKRLREIFDKTNELNPDLILITGDLVDANISGFPELSETLRILKAKYGIYAVTGNHEHYAGLNEFLEAMRRLNITVLMNANALVAGNLKLIGIDDTVSALGAGAEKEIEAAGSFGENVKKKKKEITVLLSHRPDAFIAASKFGINLQLSGHTHAGQIPPMDLIVLFAFKYPLGLYKNGDSYLYTTAGTGYWGPPMRLFSHSEIVKIVLEK